VLVAPEPDGQTPHAFDEVYVVLDGEGDIEVEGELRHVSKGDAVFVAARADHRFSGYESLSLLVVFNGPHTASKPA
jgi:mannose-6-phosphate isomerase-like protein (cupin superfamily)